VLPADRHCHWAACLTRGVLRNYYPSGYSCRFEANEDRISRDNPLFPFDFFSSTAAAHSCCFHHLEKISGLRQKLLWKLRNLQAESQQRFVKDIITVMEPLVHAWIQLPSSLPPQYAPSLKASKSGKYCVRSEAAR